MEPAGELLHRLVEITPDGTWYLIHVLKTLDLSGREPHITLRGNVDPSLPDLLVFLEHLRLLPEDFAPTRPSYEVGGTRWAVQVNDVGAIVKLTVEFGDLAGRTFSEEEALQLFASALHQDLYVEGHYAEYVRWYGTTRSR